MYPITLALIGLSAGGALISGIGNFFQQRSQAEDQQAQADLAKAAAQLNAEKAKSDFNNTVRDIGTQQLQTQGTAAARFGTANVGGSSVDAIQTAIDTQANLARSDARTALDFGIRGVDLQFQDAQRAADRASQVKRDAWWNIVGGGFNATASGINTYASLL